MYTRRSRDGCWSVLSRLLECNLYFPRISLMLHKHNTRRSTKFRSAHVNWKVHQLEFLKKNKVLTNSHLIMYIYIGLDKRITIVLTLPSSIQ